MVIQIFTTGGTIDKTYYDAKSVYEVGEPQITTILREANVTADYAIETLFRKDSLDLTDDDRALIARRVREAEAAHVVITHGTDTMVETARALQEEVEGKTIVLVGSLSPARFRESDAVFNVGFAMAAVQALPPGAYVAMNGRLLDPTHARKNREANRFEPADEEAAEHEA